MKGKLMLKAADRRRLRLAIGGLLWKLTQVLRLSKRAKAFFMGKLHFARPGMTSGSRPELYGTCVFRLTDGGLLRVGNKFKADGGPVASKFQAQEGGAISFGDNCFVNYGADLNSSCRIAIGDNVRIGPFVSIVDDSMHDVDQTRKRVKLPIVIGDNVWIGRGSVVLPGSTIDDHVVIGAGSVVRGHLAARTLNAGAPAREIRDLSVPDQNWRRI